MTRIATELISIQPTHEAANEGDSLGQHGVLAVLRRASSWLVIAPRVAQCGLQEVSAAFQSPPIAIGGRFSPARTF